MSSNTAMKRMMSDIRSLNEEPIDGAYTYVDEANILNATAMVIGPQDTPYQDGFYFFTLKFPKDYPFSPPAVDFYSSRLDNKVRFNPNLYENGKVCLSKLDLEADYWKSMLIVQKPTFNY